MVFAGSWSGLCRGQESRGVSVFSLTPGLPSSPFWCTSPRCPGCRRSSQGRSETERDMLAAEVERLRQGLATPAMVEAISVTPASNRLTRCLDSGCERSRVCLASSPAEVTTPPTSAAGT